MRPAYVISLPGSPRRPAIAAHLEARGIPYRFWDGVRVPADAAGRQGLLRSLAPGLDASRVTLTDGTLGTLLAYVTLWRHLAYEEEEGSGGALVLEDDVVCNPGVDVARALADADALAGQLRGDYCFLHWYPCRPTGAQAQIVTRKAARMLADHTQAVLEKNSPVDLMLWENCAVADLAIGNAYGVTGTWLFRHASDYGDEAQSERMRINRERHRTAADTVG